MDRFCIDTSFFINSWVRDYPKRIPIFTPIWTSIEERILDGSILICREVHKEISKKDDDLNAWMQAFRSYVVPPNEEQLIALREIMRRWPTFAAVPGRNNADPWVITLAQTASAIVVTGESREFTKPSKPPKIPNFCDELKIKCLRPIEFIEALKLTHP